MSGLEALAALSLACNIFQVISFGRETLGLVKKVYRDGTLDNSLVDKSITIQGVASSIIGVNIPQSGNQEQRLVDVTKKCTGVARGMEPNGMEKLEAFLTASYRLTRRDCLSRWEEWTGQPPCDTEDCSQGKLA